MASYGASRGNPGRASTGTCIWWGSWSHGSSTAGGTILEKGANICITGNNVAEALRILVPQDTELWKPTLVFSTATDETVIKQEDRQNEMEFRADLDNFMKRRRMYENNLFKAYALIWERCAKAMQNKYQEQVSKVRSTTTR